MGCFDFSKFFLDEKMGFNRIFRWFDRVQDLDSARACSPVFESNQFSERKHFPPRRPFGQPVLGGLPLKGFSLYRVFLATNRGEGICFEFMLWIFDEFLRASYMRVFTGFCSNFLWMVAGWFGFLVPFGRTGAVQRSQRTRGTVGWWTSAITFLMPDQERVSNDEPEEDGLCENLKYANSV